MHLAALALSVPFLHAATEIPQGSHALLRMVNSVSTRTAREGDYVYMRTARRLWSMARLWSPWIAMSKGWSCAPSAADA